MLSAQDKTTLQQDFSWPDIFIVAIHEPLISTILGETSNLHSHGKSAHAQNEIISVHLLLLI